MIDIDLEQLKQQQKELDEGMSATQMINFGHRLKPVISALLRGGRVDARVSGLPSDVRSFIKALASEKNYLQSFKDHGLESHFTSFSKARLDTSVKAFERATGLAWPLK